MNYEKIYSMLIETRKNRDTNQDNYYEKHHIWPKSLGGPNEKWNMVHLTAREHFLAHWLLYKITNGEDKIKMGHAWFRMCHNENVYKKISSKEFEISRLAKIESMKNRAIKKETRKKLSDLIIGKNNPMYGKTGSLCPNYGAVRSLETRNKISKSKSGVNIWKNKTHPMKNKEHSENTKKKISEGVIKKYNEDPSIKQKISAASKNRAISAETRKKMSDAQSGSNHWNSKKYIVKFIDGQTYLIINGYKRFCKEFNITRYSFTKCLKDKISMKNIEFVKYYQKGDYFTNEW